MKNTYKRLNISDARAPYVLGRNDALQYWPLNNNSAFSDYSPAYVLSNENLRWGTGLTRNMAKRVLTTAGSGDQAMFYALHGATHIDTFDISFCARVIQNIKTAAIHHLTRDQYIKLLNEIHNTGNAMQLQHMSDIISHIPDTDAQFIRNMYNCRIFGYGLRPDNYPEYYPTQHEYTQLQQLISKPFKFIWSDLASLHTHLLGEYDVINLSNIFQYQTPDQIHHALASLRNHVAIGGYILTSDEVNLPALFNSTNKMKRWAKVFNAKYYAQPQHTVPRERIFAIQRTR
ncbi:MAG: DUF3419 family protein [Muribaculaceae bacterium]|nr:DUF3419 family protein [Muribaculaceae bacterium]